MPSHDDRGRGIESGGRLAIVGIGPGGLDQMTVRARDAIGSAEYVIGNGTYLDQIASLLHGKEIVRSSMGREVERARQPWSSPARRPWRW